MPKAPLAPPSGHDDHPPAHTLRVGLVSDTHGLFEERLRDLFRPCDLILHAGDVVAPRILTELAQMAPVRAVRGNNDIAPDFDTLPEVTWVDLNGLGALLLHDRGSPGRHPPPLARALARNPARIVVYGHSHRPACAMEGDLLFLNPGSAGPRRFTLPRSAGLLEVTGRKVRVRLFDLAHPELPLLAPPFEALL